jgi:hypothetical protein
MKYTITRWRGEYLEYADETSCGWTYLSDIAMTFPTYQKAYYMAKKLNNRYGRKVASVVKID